MARRGPADGDHRRGGVALCVPWVVRNEVQVGRVGLSSVGGLNFYLAHRANGYGFAYDTPLAGLDEVSMSRRGYVLGIEHLREDPVGLLDDVAVGTRRLYEPPRYAAFYSTRSFAPIAPYPRSVSASLLSDVRTVDQDGWYIIAALAVAGWILLIANRRRAALVVTGFAAANWICFTVMFWALPRYRFPVEPLLCITAAVAIDTLIRRFSRVRRAS